MTLNQRGYLLQEALIGLLILSVVVLNLLHCVPPLLHALSFQSQVQQMNAQLYEMADLLLTKQMLPFESYTVQLPFLHTFTLKDDTLCVHFQGVSSHEQTRCLFE